MNVLANDTDPGGGASRSTRSNQRRQRHGRDHRRRLEPDLQPRRRLLQRPGRRRPTNFTYTLNGGSTATVSVDGDLRRRHPDRGRRLRDGQRGRPRATTINVLANDTERRRRPDHDRARRPTATNGTVVITGGGSNLTYKPDAELLQRPGPARPDDTFTYTLNGGSTATVSVDGDLRRRQADRGQRLADGRPRTPPRTRWTCSRTTLNADGGPMTIDLVDPTRPRHRRDHRRRLEPDLQAGGELLQRRRPGCPDDTSPTS